MNAREKYNSLTIKSAWSYAKQKANFLDLYLSTKLFSEIPDILHTNVESYFENNYERYGISTYRHRILSIAQMFGLITKNVFYKKPAYSIERTTNVGNALLNHEPDSLEYKKILSEQLIKMKQKAIIDTTNFRDDYHIYPFLFLFLTMWKLDKDYGIKKVPVKKIWTYVFTCKSMDDLNDCVSWLFDPTAKISPFVDGTDGYKGNSRMMKLILENTMMFSQEDDQLSLNHPIADDFYQEFVLKQNLSLLQTYLYDDVKYKEFLENIQNFDFDLTYNPTGVVKRSRLKRAVFKKHSDVGTESTKEVEIVIPDVDSDDVDSVIDTLLDFQDEQDVKEAAVYNSEGEINASNNREPVLKSGLETNNRYSTDARLAKTAIKNAGYVCELVGHIDGSHTTFDSVHGTKYLEAHHLVPMKAQKDYVSLGINLDRLENIVALCPNCHKAVHYGTRAEKVRYLRPLYDARINKLNELGIDIDLDVLIDDYYK